MKNDRSGHCKNAFVWQVCRVRNDNTMGWQGSYSAADDRFWHGRNFYRRVTVCWKIWACLWQHNCRSAALLLPFKAHGSRNLRLFPRSSICTRSLHSHSPNTVSARQPSISVVIDCILPSPSCLKEPSAFQHSQSAKWPLVMMIWTLSYLQHCTFELRPAT